MSLRNLSMLVLLLAACESPQGPLVEEPQARITFEPDSLSIGPSAPQQVTVRVEFVGAVNDSRITIQSVVDGATSTCGTGPIAAGAAGRCTATLPPARTSHRWRVATVERWGLNTWMPVPFELAAELRLTADEVPPEVRSTSAPGRVTYDGLPIPVPLSAEAVDEGEVRSVTFLFTSDGSAVATPCAAKRSGDVWTCDARLPNVTARWAIAVDVRDQAGNRTVQSVGLLDAEPDPRLSACDARAIDLEVGERIEVAAADCLALPAGRLHALAFFDPDVVRAAATGELTGVAGLPKHTYTIAPVSWRGSPTLRTGSVAPALANPVTASTAGCPHICRDRPFVAGERFWAPADVAVLGITDTLEVRAVQGGYAFAESSTQRASNAWWHDFLTDLSAVDQGRALLRSAFRPVECTAGGSGQVLVVVTSQLTSRAHPVSDGRVCGGAVVVSAAVDPHAARSILIHELAHLWFFDYLASLREGTPLLAPQWAVEGVPDLVRQDVFRRRAGFAPDQQDGVVASTDAFHYRELIRNQTGELALGYGSTAGYLRGLYADLVRAGLDEDAALREVARGAAEGFEGVLRTAGGVAAGLGGLRQRVAPWLGPAWEPERSLIDWTLSVAVDDRIPDYDLGVRYLRGAWQPGVTLWYRVLSPTGALAGKPAYPCGSYDSQYLQVAPGSGGFFYLDSRACPARIRIDTDAPAARWFLVRLPDA